MSKRLTIVMAFAAAAAFFLAAVQGMAEDKKEATPTPKATTASAPAESKTFTGTVESTHTQKRPRLVVEGTHYELKVAEKAEASVKETLEKISKGEATGTYTVKGIVTTEGSRSTIMVESIDKAEKKEEPKKIEPKPVERD